MQQAIYLFRLSSHPDCLFVLFGKIQSQELQGVLVMPGWIEFQHYFCQVGGCKLQKY